MAGHDRVEGIGGQPRRSAQGPAHCRDLQGVKESLLLRQHNWLLEPPLARCSPSKGGGRPWRSHNGQRPCLSSHLLGGWIGVTPLLFKPRLGGLPAGRRCQVGLVVGRWPVPPRAATPPSCQIQTFPAAPSGNQTQQWLVRVTERQPGREIDRPARNLHINKAVTNTTSADPEM